MTEEKVQEFINNIPMRVLFGEIRKRTGLYDLEFNHHVAKCWDGKPSIKFESQDIADKVGFLNGLLFKTIKIAQFNSQVYEEKDGELRWWGTVSFAYTHPDGGSNGHTFMDFGYTEREGFRFK